MPSPGEAQASIVIQRFTDPAEVAAAIRDAGIDYVPLEAGPYEARLMTLQLGTMLIQRAEDRAHVVRGVLQPDRTALLMPLRQLAPPVINGRPDQEGECLRLAPGGLHRLCPAAVDWASLSLSSEDADQLLELAGMPAMSNPRIPMLTLPPDV